MDELEEEIKATLVIVHPGRYAYLKAKKLITEKHFLVSQDKDEITIVTEEKHVSETQHEKAVTWFKLIEFKITKPFLCVGFLAAITKAVASKGLNVMIVSTFSKDYALIREEDSEAALEALREIGFSIN